MRGLLRAAEALQDGEVTLDDPAIAKAWERGLEALERCYSAGGTTDYGDDVGVSADIVQANLSVVNGARTFMRGGDLGDDFYPMPLEAVAEQIAKCGNADGFEIRPQDTANTP